MLTFTLAKALPQTRLLRSKLSDVGIIFGLFDNASLISFNYILIGLVFSVPGEEIRAESVKKAKNKYEASIGGRGLSG